MPHSIHDRLLALARERNRPFNELLQYFAMERFLYRLGRSPAARHFVLKGALLMTARASLPFRPTRDIDLMGRTVNSEENIRELISSVCLQHIPEDGMRFDADSITMERIKQGADYPGVRVRFNGYLGQARVPMQVDIGFGDAVTPAPDLIEYPVLLDMAAPRLRAYPLETAMAEKIHAMVHLGELNSRMKDFMDVWILCRHKTVKLTQLRKAVMATFARRKTDFPSAPVCFSPEFAASKQSLWAAMLRKNPSVSIPRDLATVLGDIWGVIEPIFRQASNRRPGPLVKE